MRVKSTVLPAVLVLLQLCGSLCARTTTAREAEMVVSGWLKVDPRPLSMTLGQQVMRVETFTDESGQPAYYIVYLEPSGFVIVSADDLVEPIIGFVDGGTYDPRPENALGALVSKDLNRRIATARKSIKLMATAPQPALTNNQQKWGRFVGLAELSDSNFRLFGMPPMEDTPSDLRVPALVKSLWGQTWVYGPDDRPRACFNYYTPRIVNDQIVFVEDRADNYPCGCVATTMAQVMRYHMYPVEPVQPSQFRIYVHSLTTLRPLIRGEGPNGAYNWDQMVADPDTGATDEQRRAIGAICHDAGVAVNTLYTAWGAAASLSDAAKALVDTFQYDNAVAGGDGDSEIGAQNWIEMINPNLDASLPVVLGIMYSPEPYFGHGIVCDGYGYQSETLYHHLNMGWYGYANCWYNLPDIDYPDVQRFDMIVNCLYNVFSEGTGEIVSGRIVNTEGQPIELAEVTAESNSGGQPHTAVANSNGIYALKGLDSDSTYTLTVNRPGYDFERRKVGTGTSRDSSSVSGNRWGVDFTGYSNFVTVTIGTGTSDWDYPMHTSYHDSRTQVIYLASEIGSGGVITALALDVSEAPGQMMEYWTIRMKHTPMSEYDTCALEANGWTVVYQNYEEVDTGWRRFEFQTPFEYNGTDNLLVDFSHNNSDYTANGSCKASRPGGTRSVYACSDSQYEDPLNWSGTTLPRVYGDTDVPNVRLTLGRESEVVRGFIKLTASDAQADDTFGCSVAISGDYAIVGADGSTYIFEHEGTNWTQQAKLNVSDGQTPDRFGCSVSICEDRAIVGAYGSAYIFKREGTSWTQQAKLTASGTAYFGLSVSITRDYAIVGAYGDDELAINAGAAYIFERNGTGWAEQAKLTASDGSTDDLFGHSVSISGDYCIVGASGDDDNGRDFGSAYIFQREDTNWTQQDKLTALDGAGDDNFGNSVSICGNYAVVGIPNDDHDIKGRNSGSAYIFQREGTNWTQQDKLTALDGARDDNFGSSVSIDGGYAIVGAPGDDDNGNDSGSGYIFIAAQYTLTTSSTAGGSVSAPGEGSFPYDPGTVVPIEATADPNYRFVNWTGSAVDAGQVADPNSATTTVTMHADCTLEANFALAQHTLTISSATGGSVSVPGEGSFQYDHGVSVEVTAAPDLGYEVETWYLDGEAVQVGGTTYTLSDIQTDHTLHVAFKLLEYKITPSAGAHGSIDPCTPVTVCYGQSQQFTAVPDIDYEVDTWSVDGNDVQSGGNTYTLSDIQADHEVHVTFKPEEPAYFAEASLKAAVEAALGISDPTPSDMLSLTRLEADNLGISDLTGLEYATNLTQLCLRGNKIYNISTLSQLTNLAELDLSDNRVSDISPLLALKNLQKLDLRGNFLNESAHTTHLLQICENNPDLEPLFDPFVEVSYVDADAPEDPGPNDPNLSDPNEDGSPDHPFDSIQESIDLAADGQTIIVLEGTYYENIKLTDKNITLTSEVPDDPDVTANTVIDGSGADSVLTLINGQDTRCVLAGFAITNGCAELGGGIQCNGSSPTIVRCTFTGNSAGYGGGFANLMGSPTLINCTFTANRAEFGGAMYNAGQQDTGQTSLTNCALSGNVAQQAGGGMYNDEAHVELTNCTFADNWAPAGNALACDSSDQLHPTDVRLSNCILWDGPDEVWTGGGSVVTIAYSDVQGGQESVHDPCEAFVWDDSNINADPRFVLAGYWADPNDPNIPAEPNDPNAIWITGDYHLLVGSPCIDAGDSNAVPADIIDLDGDGDANEPTPLDLDGILRFVDDPATSDTGHGAPPIVDMGAYEFVPPAHLVAVKVIARPQPSDWAETAPPEHQSTYHVRQTFYLELWAQVAYPPADSDGLCGVFGDVAFDDTMASVESVEHGADFGTFSGGTIEAGRVDELGGCSLTGGVGIAPQWALIAQIEMIARGEGQTSISLTYADTGCSVIGYGLVPPEQISLESCQVTVETIAATCIYDLDGDGTIGPGDLALFACCWLCPVSDSGCDGLVSCVDCDFDGDGWVGPGDVSWLATAWLKPCDDPSIQYPPGKGQQMAFGARLALPRSTAPDVEVRPVILGSQSPSDTTGTLPTSIVSVVEGQDYYVEIWASDVGSTNTGLTSVYVHMDFGPSVPASVQSIRHGGIFTTFSSGTIRAGGIEDLGGSSLTAAGIAPQWARVATVKMHAEASGPVSCSLGRSTPGIAALGRGLVAWTQIALGGDDECFPAAYSTYNDWLSFGKPACWCRPYQCDGDADDAAQGSQNYRVFTHDLERLLKNWKKPTTDPDFDPCADFDHKAQVRGEYRVGTDDLDILIANWKKKATDLPGDCPRLE